MYVHSLAQRLPRGRLPFLPGRSGEARAWSEITAGGAGCKSQDSISPDPMLTPLPGGTPRSPCP